MEKAKLIIVLGGVRSGKSREAEKRAIAEAEKLGGKLHYVACGKVTDEEMAARVRSHQKQRERAGQKWTTWEQPSKLSLIAGKFTRKDIVLIDCLTTLLTNEWFEDGTSEEEWGQSVFHEKVKRKIETGISEIRKSAGAVFIVSNELAFEPLGTPLVFHYAKTLGELHQQLTADAQLAVIVEHGHPIVKKKGASK
ncbi:cobinamide kinase [Bacillus aerolatus]|uniref:Adenosylcobinamide kinase n=1 Tax=Bacillus aerolatus TaxID=2653354 RepID=A0A6I1FI92_9BACI|nr:bifunctional adenosylcobinamide kinase/adenosylcobinamide-phosphate guanylyltransferase [Bacillus aerolatus]KAB7705374.1 cobinamide kinase [Bacillus aerolatus]